MTEQGCLKATSVLFWLAALLAVGIIFVGGRFLFDPFAAARDFGVPAAHNSTLAYLWTKGTRDIVSGLLLISLLCLGVRRAVLSTFIFIATLIPLADFVNVYINVRSERPRALLIHGGTAVFMIILASLILHGRRTEGNKQSAAVNENVRLDWADLIPGDVVLERAAASMAWCGRGGLVQSWLAPEHIVSS
jgi:Domain of unknown function (DUF4267)